MKQIAIAGAGLSGAVIANELAKTGRFRIDIFETRNHVAGNCHTERDLDTGILLHLYGPHIFHTNDELIWNYVNKFDRFLPFTNRVKAITGGKIYSLPINLLTINQFFQRTLSPSEARDFLHTKSENISAAPRTFEEQALRFVGRELYEAFFQEYTRKQWGVAPSELPASILQRLPIRFSYDDNYYSSRYQGMPEHGYTYIVERMLDHPAINLHLQEKFDRALTPEFDHVFFTGPLDAWFGHSEGRLAYRTLDFQRERHQGDYQGNAVINYCDSSAPWTRISEHKHFSPWEEHNETIIFKEYSRSCEPADTPYYPVRLIEEKVLLRRYIALALEDRNVTFVGRLGTYRYLDMHVAIAEALKCARSYVANTDSGCPADSFSVSPL